MSSEFLALAKSIENLPHTTARPVHYPKGKYHLKVNVQRITDMSVRFQGAVMIYIGLRRIFQYVKQLTVEYGRHTFNANSMLIHKENGGKNRRSIACYVITDNIGTEKLLISPLPVFNLYHSGYIFLLCIVMVEEFRTEIQKGLGESFLWQRAKRKRGMKNLGAIHHESSLPFIQQKFQFMFEFLIRNRKTEKE